MKRIPERWQNKMNDNESVSLMLAIVTIKSCNSRSFKHNSCPVITRNNKRLPGTGGTGHCLLACLIFLHLLLLFSITQFYRYSTLSSLSFLPPPCATLSPVFHSNTVLQPSCWLQRSAVHTCHDIAGISNGSKSGILLSRIIWQFYWGPSFIWEQRCTLAVLCSPVL